MTLPMYLTITELPACSVRVLPRVGFHAFILPRLERCGQGIDRPALLRLCLNSQADRVVSIPASKEERRPVLRLEAPNKSWSPGLPNPDAISSIRFGGVDHDKETAIGRKMRVVIERGDASGGINLHNSRREPRTRGAQPSDARKCNTNRPNE